jgi:7-cyano-7-deazaguanine synthase
VSTRARAKGSVVLLSGGMDSATCVAVAARDEAPVHALTVLYGQRHAREVSSARALARYFHVARHTVLRLPLGPLLDSTLTRPDRPLPRAAGRSAAIPSTYVPARNTILLAVALGYAESHHLRSIYIGANAIDYSGYPDCRPPFLRAFERVARLGTRAGVERGERIRVKAPLLRLSKERIVRWGNRLGVPWKLTWSCYAGGQKPCGACDACRLRALGFAAAGTFDPTLGQKPKPKGRNRGRRGDPIS